MMIDELMKMRENNIMFEEPLLINKIMRAVICEITIKPLHQETIRKVMLNEG